MSGSVTIYVACALTQAPEDFKQDVKGFKESLRGCGFEVLDSVGLEDGTDVDVYRHKCRCADRCDLLVAICDIPSIDLGMEIKRRIMQEKPIMLAFHRNIKSITRMVTGAGREEPFATPVLYSSWSELEDRVIREVRRIKRGSN